MPDIYNGEKNNANYWVEKFQIVSFTNKMSNWMLLTVRLSPDHINHISRFTHGNVSQFFTWMSVETVEIVEPSLTLDENTLNQEFTKMVLFQSEKQFGMKKCSNRGTLFCNSVSSLFFIIAIFHNRFSCNLLWKII